jgi:light-harvesting complex I chlorophyll a/b binding protein 1
MSEYMNLGQEQIHRGTFSGKALLAVPLTVGFALGVFFSPVLLNRSEVETPAINMMGGPMTCLKVPTLSVNALQSTLRKNGVAPSPMERFALTSFVATRDVSMKAQAKQEFSKLDPATQSKLKKLSKDLVVRAAAFDLEDAPGVSAPLGFWDPAGFAKDEESFLAYRRAEIKHGRVCMSSSLGMLVADKFHPIFDNWNEGPFVSSAASHFSETATKNFWPAFWIMTAGHELATTFADYDGKEEFDYGFDPLNLRPEDAEKELEYKTMELNHGRWAMFCAAGILAQELVTGTSVI